MTNEKPSQMSRDTVQIVLWRIYLKFWFAHYAYDHVIQLFNDHRRAMNLWNYKRAAKL
jgi:hypothetical protein